MGVGVGRGWYWCDSGTWDGGMWDGIMFVYKGGMGDWVGSIGIGWLVGYLLIRPAIFPAENISNQGRMCDRKTKSI
jgi:hypothetical protein